MPVLQIDDSSVDLATEALRSGTPVVIPGPSPLAYAITGTRAAAVNAAKGRPASQPAGVGVADMAVIAPYLDLCEDLVSMAGWLCGSELVSLLAPIRPDPPEWLSPAISDGMAFFTSTPWLPALSSIIAEFGYLYMSSANITGSGSATSAAEAGRAFGERLVVLDGDAFRDPSRTHGSTTMVRVSRDGELTVARPGINNVAFGADLTGYAAELSRRWEQHRTR
ncbi:Sua5/YciO/YrdC/YwlC family protein [Actinospica sp.]|jgi:tRNA A37 threonylcarbamoyladenosine synthetase subunit TsaC/SUA5/YrdC|uniref:Sua5/YciO/YrdC/YwlC family protein n=1 Tax=Actinospica sp. TaxID=1872142 RepID=UPI002C28AC53|nr:Sua5/YciO/YrdC/YwlC family protein [Actinospica sp.]HWG23795.1 Sua5/YciO/YrdC/YwlC family protein [Actinospica sp.]